MFFQWSVGVLAALDGFHLILLRLEQGDYLSLSPRIADILGVVFTIPFRPERGRYVPLQDCTPFSKNEIVSTIECLLKQGILETCVEAQGRRITITKPLEKGGISELEWFPKVQGVSLEKMQVLSAWFALRKSHRVIQRRGMGGLVSFLTLKKCQPFSDINFQLSSVLAKALERASLFFTKKTICLPYAAALAILHHRANLSCDFIIGVQSRPFLAHAWVESGGQVINDNPNLQKKLAPLLRISNQVKD